MTHETYLITINVSPALEEAMVDCLLTFETAQGFSSFPVNAHDHRNQGLSIAEQVTGRQRKMRFQMYIDKDHVSALLSKIKADFSGTGLHYWMVPVLEHGEI
ncbi:hypothetical protein A1359_06300 [Methylomonas lenta]|uniref:DUF3240 domain-containing protein n=1 Tax=Methylomonas lenta TaxID=980561 RepID=A0A177NGP7_9GAMM|nr:DUF3240 family protein [Methylomonas lenta]OAI17276.1 hypothetical protein A1359_06300 [Methylomonas lenta]